jgi:hypothetical protein
MSLLSQHAFVNGSTRGMPWHSNEGFAAVQGKEILQRPSFHPISSSWSTINRDSFFYLALSVAVAIIYYSVSPVAM